MSFWHEYIHLLTDWAHVAFEVTYELITAVVLYPFAKWFWGKAIKKHDRDHHGMEH